MEKMNDGKGNDVDKAIRTFEETAKLRKTRTEISSAAGVIILLLIAYLVIDMVRFVKTYNANKVVQEVSKELPKMWSSDPMQKLLRDVREKVIPKYLGEISTKMTAAEPRFEAESLAVLDSMASEIGSAVQARVTEEMAKILAEADAMIRTRHPDFRQEDIVIILDTLQKEIQRQYGEHLNEQLAYLFADINKSLESIRADAGYKILAKQETQKLEKMLLTTSLELASYEIDPELGAVR